MRSAFKNEALVLQYIGQWFDPKIDYRPHAKRLVHDLLRDRDQPGAVQTIDSVIKLVSSRIEKPTKKVDVEQQRAFLKWLKGVRRDLGPEIKFKKPVSKPKSPYTRQRRRHWRGALGHEKQGWDARNARV
ncbi:hypothetical protein [Asticcacaulis sp. W401b]|uniref:hypothetical protein n=1 Tax=Asticcacaulis sp. W401b TaxID=3388666 RepID=UPI00397110FA